MEGDPGSPLNMRFLVAGASSVTLVLWGSTGCPAVIEAFDANGNLVDHRSIAAVPGRKGPNEPVPFLTVRLKAPVIASVNLSGPRDGEFLAADELRFVPLPGK